MKLLDKVGTKWLLIITGFFSVEGAASFVYSLISEHSINYEAILLSICMSVGFWHFYEERIKDHQSN